MKYLTITLHNQIRGIELDQVREWLGYMPFTAITSADPATVGTLDYRGHTIPVIDLRIRFSLPVSRTEWTSMIIIEQLGQLFALIVDNVLGLRDTASPAKMNEKPLTPIDLTACINPRRDFKIAA